MVEMDIHSLEQLEEKICNVKEQQKELKNDLENMVQKHKRVNEVTKYLKQYRDTTMVFLKSQRNCAKVEKTSPNAQLVNT